MGPDSLTPAQARRYELWCALDELAQVRDERCPSWDQEALLRALADNLERLAGQLREVADLGRATAHLLEQPGRR